MLDFENMLENAINIFCASKKCEKAVNFDFCLNCIFL